jgi:D-alanine-D-alanine ligase
MRVVVLHQQIDGASSIDEQDVALQRHAVVASLQRLGHEVECLGCDLNLSALRDSLQANRPNLVFNLVESLGGSDLFISTVPMLLDTLGIPHTGASSEALLLSSSKVIAKRALYADGLPTAPWAEVNPRRNVQIQGPTASLGWPSAWIRKPIWEHASLGMTDEAVITCASPSKVIEAAAEWQERLGRPCFAEAFIAGREFNLSLLEHADGPEVLPPAEIDFSGYPAGRPRIVGYAAKWAEDSAESIGTPRRFDFPPSDAALLDQLRHLALQCWDAFQLSGYCRVDFRVDDAGQPWILEINANPCLTPGSGFAAAVERASYSYDDAIERILQAATV